MIKSSTVAIISAVISTVGLDEAQDIISPTIADYGVLAGMIIGGLGALAKFAEIISEQIRRWFEYFDKKNKDQDSQ